MTQLTQIANDESSWFNDHYLKLNWKWSVLYTFNWVFKECHLVKVLSFKKVNTLVITISAWLRAQTNSKKNSNPVQCGQNICFDNLMKALCQCQHNFLWLLSENNTIFIQDNPLFIRGSSKLSQGETILWTDLCYTKITNYHNFWLMYV